MRIKRIKLTDFRRFTDLEIIDLPQTTRLVVMAGPNGCGKSSIFDAFALRYQSGAGMGWTNDAKYYGKIVKPNVQILESVSIDMHGDEKFNSKGSFYFRTAYRNDPEFSLSTLDRVGPPVDELRFRRMIEGDAAVSLNFKRLVSQAFEDLFKREDSGMTIGQFREQVVAAIRDPVKRLFPDLLLNSLGNPLEDGTFRFDKGPSKAFEYRNLSGGEKAAFDLILDMVVKGPAFPNAIYCIDEPEAHMNTRLQGQLLEELFGLLPEASQLWLATHSIGMMRKARELAVAKPGAVAFLDFGDRDFDTKVVITPSAPTRAFWEKVLKVALDDLASLVAPSEVIVCEGNPAGAAPGKNVEHDARCYDAIFSDEFPDAKFISGGSSKDVSGDRLGFVAALPKVAVGITVRRLIDRDDHAPPDVIEFGKQGITVLDRRHIESYLYDDEILTALCVSLGEQGEVGGILSDKQQALAAAKARGRPADDIKAAAGELYDKVKKRLKLTGVGNDQEAFARNKLVPLIEPSTQTYQALRSAIFGT